MKEKKQKNKQTNILSTYLFLNDLSYDINSIQYLYTRTGCFLIMISSHPDGQ